ncbi:MAG: hypothetical protein B0W54_14390 [Cellvibrio sp. 79]|nr:MAG: hypothetical protein B0W54_14390 [Cellvibrio sp. 79]
MNTEADTTIIDTIEAYASVVLDDPVNDFAYQLSTARFLGQMCRTDVELQKIHSLMEHYSPHMQRLGSLAFCYLPYRWYAKTLPLVQKNLTHSLKWIRYDSIRFFFFQSCLDESVFELLHQQQKITDDSDITKAIHTALAALTDLRNSYALPLKSIQVDDFIVDVPINWQVGKDRHIHVFQSAPLASLRLNTQQYPSMLRLSFARNLTPEEIREMPIFNIEAKVEGATIIHTPAYVKPGSYRATYHHPANSEGITELTTTEFTAWDDSTLLIANLMSPLVHKQWAMERNINILNSIRRA